LEVFGLKPTGERWENPEGPISGALLVSGWYVVWFDQEFVDEGVVRKVSTGREAVAGFVEEHVMFSASSGWRDEEMVWALAHQSEKGIYHLDASGELPPQATRPFARRGTRSSAEREALALSLIHLRGSARRCEGRNRVPP
jgi:hypothetical protein